MLALQAQGRRPQGCQCLLNLGLEKCWICKKCKVFNTHHCRPFLSTWGVGLDSGVVGDGGVGRCRWLGGWVGGVGDL